MAEHVTTVPSKPQITLAELKTDAVQNLLYLVHGLGRDRDKTLDIEVLKSWISETLSRIKMSNLILDRNGIRLNEASIEDPNYNFSLKGGELMLSKSLYGDDEPEKFIIVNVEKGIYNLVGGTQQSPEYILSLLNEIRTNKKIVVTSGSKTLTIDTTKIELDIDLGDSHSYAGFTFNADTGYVETYQLAVESLSEKTNGGGISISGALNCDDVNVAAGKKITVGAIGNQTVINGGNVTATGNVSTTGTITGGKVHASTYMVTNILSNNVDYSLAQEEGADNHAQGDVVYIRNTANASIKITIANTILHGAGYTQYVNLNSACCVGFVCISPASASTRSIWAPMSNMTVTTENAT